MSKKFVYVDANGDFTESPGAFEVSEHINASTGVSDAAKPIVTDAAGVIDSSFIDESGLDHGSMGGLGDDDHTIYTLADGTRAFSGDQSMGSNKITSLSPGTSGTDAVNKDQLDSAVSGLQDFRESVIDKDLLTPPGSPSAGDRYIIGQPGDTATGVWAGLEGKLVEYNGSSYDVEADPDEGTYVYVEDEDSAYIFNNNVFASGMWVIFNSGIYTASLGVELSGNDFRADLLASGGLKLTGNEIGVEPADFAGTGLQDDGADNMEIDFADTSSEMATSRAVQASDLSTNGANQGAKILGADPATIAVSSATTIQGILEDLDNAIAGNDSNTFTTDVVGVTAGDVVYLTGNDIVTVMPITAGHKSVGIAVSTVGASASVEILKDQTTLTGIFVGATAGDRYYWDGSSLTTSIPSGSGSYVWQAGYAKNATDLFVDIDFIKKNT